MKTKHLCSLPLQKNLKNRLESAKRVVLLGIGSELKSDDGAGMLIAELVQAGLKKIKHSEKLELQRRKPNPRQRVSIMRHPPKSRFSGRRRIKTIFGSTAPENFTGEIIKFKADHVVMVDCADISKKPGSICIIDPENIGGTSFSTHMLPINIMTGYLVQSINCGITIIGIQPKSIDYGSIISPAVKKAAKEVSAAILSSIK
ncbi:MAG: hydrogenase 3 maturation endopeptidase HyCI [Elusimicrobiota bacterium]